jgi:hypothetical protein
MAGMVPGQLNRILKQVVKDIRNITADYDGTGLFTGK